MCTIGHHINIVMINSYHKQRQATIALVKSSPHTGVSPEIFLGGVQKNSAPLAFRTLNTYFYYIYRLLSDPKFLFLLYL